MATDAFSDFVVGHGELWSAQLLAAAVRQRGADVEFMDTRDVLVRWCFFVFCFVEAAAAIARAALRANNNTHPP